jgi:HEPN domain-containing protein
LVDSKRYKDWFDMAEKDLKSSRILVEHDADNGIVCFHCQQAIEKCFKGYLIVKSGELVEGHSLVKLCRKSVEYDNILKSYLKDCAYVSAFYIETRYPAEDPMTVSKEDAIDCIKIAETIINKVVELIG